MDHADLPLLDLSGLACPHVVLRLADHMRGLAAGASLAMTSTDPLSAIDVPFYLARAGHLLLAESKAAGRFTFVIRCKGPGAAPGEPQTAGR